MSEHSVNSLEIVAGCSYGGGGLPAAALADEVPELYQPLVVGTTPRGPEEHDRRELAQALEQANEHWQHPRAAELAKTLADPSARVVVTGQQPGILGGPLLTLVKALAASLWARRLRSEGQAAVAVFWVAGEDHDFAEVSQTSLLDNHGLRTMSLGDDVEPLLPVGRRSLGGQINDLLTDWAGDGGSEFWRSEVERLTVHYRPDAGFTDAFAGYLVSVLGSLCPLLLDAQDATVKRLQHPWIERLVDQRDEVATREGERNHQIRDAGFELQITPREGAAPLFLHAQGRRRRVLWRDDGFVLDPAEPSRPVSELLDALNEDPASVSPSALARPAIQDALLGTSLFVVGPGELAYLAQAAPLYDLLQIEAPSVTLRPSVALAARRKLQKLDDLDLPLPDLATGSFDADAFLARRAGTNPVPAAQEELDRTLNDLRVELERIDRNLEQPWEKTRDNVIRGLERLQSKVDASLARHDQVTVERVRELVGQWAPDGKPQERVLSSAWALGRFGPELPRQLAEVLDLTPGRMQVVSV